MVRTRFYRPTILFFLFCSTFVGATMASELDWINTAKDLDPETRESFRVAYSAWEEADQKFHQERARVYAEDPLLLEAQEREKQAGKQVNLLRERLAEYLTRLQRERPESVADFEYWRDRYGSLADMTVAIIAQAEDSRMRPFLRWWVHLHISDRPDRLPEEGQRLLPPDPAELSPDQALEIALTLARSPTAYSEDRQKVEEIEKKLQHLDLPRKDVESLAQAVAEREICNNYQSMRTPKSVDESRKHAMQVSYELAKIWPGWQEAYEQDERRRAAEALRWKPNVGRSLLIIGNLIVVGVIIVALCVRSFRLRKV